MEALPLPTCRLCGNFCVKYVDISLHQDQLLDGVIIGISDDERVRLDLIEKENKKLRKTITEISAKNENYLNASKNYQMTFDLKDRKMKQLEMIIDILNQKIRQCEGKLNRMSKKLYTLTKEDCIDTDNSF